MIDLAVVIVNWNTRALTLDALRTLKEDVAQRGPAQTHFWVVDNASSDNSAAAIRTEFPDIHLIENRENVGFAAANNSAMRAMGFGDADITANALPRAVYLLNSDTLTQFGATGTLYETLFSLPDAGVVGARLTYGDGSFQHSAFAFPGMLQLLIDLMPVPGRLYDSRLNGRYPRKCYEGYRPFPVGHTLGATMMLRREVIQKTGMFDEQFFMYAEEIDWSRRIQKAGWRIYCVPTAHVIHLVGQSTRQAKPENIVHLWESRLYLFRKYYAWPKLWLARRIVRLGMRLKIGQARRKYALRHISAKERDVLIATYRQVMRL
jgi:GT2 family glycosyltransferase